MIVLSSTLLSSINTNNPIIGYKNKVTVANITAGTTLTGYPATNLANPATYLDWRASNTTEQLVTVDLTGNIDSVDYVGIARHNFGSSGIEVSIEGKIGAGAYAQIVQGVIPVDNSPILFRFSPAVYSGVRIRMKTGTLAPRMGVVYTSSLLSVQRRVYVNHTPITLGRQRNVITGRSESGNFLGRIITGGQVATSISLSNLTPDWYRTYMDPFVLAAETTPFFFSWRPADYPRESGFVWLTGDPMPKNQRPNGMMQVDLQMAGIVS